MLLIEKKGVIKLYRKVGGIVSNSGGLIVFSDQSLGENYSGAFLQGSVELPLCLDLERSEEIKQRCDRLKDTLMRRFGEM